MNASGSSDHTALKTIFHECSQCGACCKNYRKIVLHPEEVEYIEKMGGHVGIAVSFSEIREKGLQTARKEAANRGTVYMIHPDDTGCLFLQKRDGRYYCKIYHYRPRTCRGFKCNLADGSFFSLVGDDSIHLLGQNRFGLPLERV